MCIRDRYDNVTQGLAREHRAAGQPHVAAHQSQHDGDGLADGGQEGEEGHQRPASREEFPRPGQLARRDTQPGDPFGLAQRPDPVAGHAAERVAQRGRDDASHGIKPHADVYKRQLQHRPAH